MFVNFSGKPNNFFQNKRWFISLQFTLLNQFNIKFKLIQTENKMIVLNE